MKKRLMSILLVMTMIFSMFPTTAFAEEGSEGSQTGESKITLGEATVNKVGTSYTYSYPSASVTGTGYRTLIVEINNGTIQLPNNGAGTELEPTDGSSDKLKYVKFPEDTETNNIESYIRDIGFLVYGAAKADVKISLSTTDLDGVSLVYDNAGQHFYQVVQIKGQTENTWENAKTAAGSKTFFGSTGHLATLTTEAQVAGANAVVRQALTDGNYCWLGGHYAGTGASGDYSETAYTISGWYWVADTNKTMFWSGTPAQDNDGKYKQKQYGTAVNGMPCSWGIAEPNNWNDNKPQDTVSEDTLTLFYKDDTVTWCDKADGDEQVSSYLVEYDFERITTPNTLGEGSVQATGELEYTEPVTHTVTYVMGGTVYKTDASVPNGSTIQYAPYVAGRDGYTFDGWYTDEECTKKFVFDSEVDGTTVIEATKVNENLTLYAKFTKIGSYTITYKDGGAGVTVPENGTVAAGGNYPISNMVPTREGWTFEGWKNGEESELLKPGSTISGVNSNITLTAQWKEDTVTITWPSDKPEGVKNWGGAATNTTFVRRGGTVTFWVELDEGYDINTLCVMAGGLPLAAIKGVVTTDISGDKTTTSTAYYYTFTVNNYTEVTITAPSQYTYTVTLPTGDHFTAKFVGDNRNDLAESVTYGGDSTAFTVEAADGWKINGVYANGTKLTAGDDDKYKITKVTANTTVTVDMDEILFRTVTYVLDGKQMATQSVESGKEFKLLTAPVPAGYIWNNKWYTDAEYTKEYTANKTDEDRILYGKLVAQTCTFTYDLNTDADDVKPAQIKDTIKTFGQAAQVSNVIPERTGYVFKGWALSTDGAVVYEPNSQLVDYFDEEGDYKTNVKLYAVWDVKTYKVTINAGQGCTVNFSQDSLNVAHGTKFEFSVIVDAEYREHTPEIWVHETGNSSGHSDWVSLREFYPQTLNDTSLKYLYDTIEVVSDLTININVARNQKYTVTFEYAKDLSGIYQTQQVEWNQKANQPADPVVEGYTFDGWYTKNDSFSDENKYSFDTPIKANTTVYAKMVKKQYTVTLPTPGTNAGWSVKFTGPSGDSSLTVEHGTKVTFTVTVNEGYDASAMQVGVNGKLWAADSIETSDGNTVYTYTIPAVTENINVTVVGVVRKTVTITYNANARDDVSGMPEQQVVKYYVDGADDNDKIVNQIPVRTGYTFLGWDTDSTVATATYTKEAIEAETAVANFTTDTTLYAIWEAQTLKVDLTFGGAFHSARSETSPSTTVPEPTPSNPGALDYFYEGDPITLTGTLSANAQGTMTFYKKLRSDDNSKWVVVDTVSVNGGKVGSVTTTVEPFWNEAGATGVNAKFRWEYKVEFTPIGDEGYSECSAKDDIRVYSKAISWRTVSDTDKTAQNELTIYEDNGGTKGGTTTTMTANTVYWLKIPTVIELDGGRRLKINSDVLTVGNDYEVIWQYKDANNDWVVYTTTNTDSVKIEAKYSQYSFRALVKPTAASIYTKAAEFDQDNKLVDNQYQDYLYTKPTTAVAHKATTTELVIVNTDGKLTEEANVAINGSTPFSADHLAQFEGQTITLKATVAEVGTTNKVTDGGVYFYRWDGTNATQLNDTLVKVDSNGVAELTDVVVKAYNTGDTATNNVDQFYAVYQTHETWDTSDSRGTDSNAYKYADVYIKSTSIKTPVIESEFAGTDNKTATTYSDDLTGLLAGVEHKFTLRQTGAAGVTGHWSVVALDGRTVDADNYSIQWLVKTGTNEEQAANEATQATFIVEDSKVGDMYRVKLSAKGDMEVDAYSKYVIIGTKQDVNVTVTASDEIASTDAVDVYQLDEITLTATVVGVDDKVTNKPTGTVKFYYRTASSKDNWIYLDAAALEMDNVSGNKTATIKTNKLPVTATSNTKRDLEIIAIYSGDETFNQSAAVKEASNQGEYDITVTVGCEHSKAYVTVYSSVVFVRSIENTTDTGSQKQDGIYISVVEGALLNNESSVTLKLSDIYTLDYSDTLAETVAKLKLGTDYTVQWQELNNAAAFASNYAGADNWQNITSKTGNTCELSVKQGAAYRAVITVKDTPIAKGSFNEVEQTVAGRKVYYSNILVAASAPSTLTVNVNTSNTDDGYEGIVEGEKVTIHTFTAGGSSTPISTLTAKITKQGSDKVVFEATKNDVNGHTSFEWSKDVTPGYYTLTVTATYNNGYSDKEITRTLIVRDNDYGFTVSGDNTTYNGKAQGLNVTVDNMDIESALAQKSVVVYYYTDAARTQQVEPTQADTYYVTIRLQESAYWTEKTMETTFTIAKREVEVVDLVAQAKVYDGTTNANILEIILNDAETDQTTTGLPKDKEITGIINGDSIYATGTGYTSSANAGTVELKVKDVVLAGDDKDNYVLVDADYKENFNIQRSQVKGDIANSTFLYTGSNITVPASDIYLIDQAGNVLGADQYTVTYYYHNGNGVEKVSAMNKLGKYTVIARPEQSNYKGGASETIYVVSEDPTDAAPSTDFHSALINITNTVELYGKSTKIEAAATTGETVKVEYYVSGSYTETVPTDAGRYLVRATVTHSDSTVDTAYGIYTIVKANPVLTLNAENVTYNSAQQEGYKNGTYNGSDFPTGTYYSYTGGTIQGVSYTAPTEAGTYVVTAHVPETDNYTAHEVSATFTINRKELTITADDLRRQQYGEYPDMVASFDGLATEGVAPDTSLRDVQIQPEMVFVTGYTNSADDQVGNEYAVNPVAALARNYTITYKSGSISVTNTAGRETLAIHGMIDNGDSTKNIAYYGDVIQLYAYGTQNADKTINTDSSVLEWSVTNPSKQGHATITQDGLLTITGVGTFTVTLKRGVGTAQVSTSIEITALQQEVKVIVPNVDKVYSGTSQSHNQAATSVSGKLVHISDALNNKTQKDAATDSRTEIGSQIVTAKVEGAVLYQSEIYGGLFTINDKEVTVKPGAQDTVYGSKEGYEATKYTEDGSYTGKPALSDVGVASIADAYGNLDVLDGYEILVAGTEDMNYNVKYQTKNDKDGKDVGDVNVTLLALTVNTGTLNDQVGVTSGSLNPVGKYPVNGAVVASTATLGDANVRMYGEPNWVMDYTLANLIAGDSMADLMGEPSELVNYTYGIGADANVQYNDKITKLKENNGASTNDLPDYVVETDSGRIAFGNYDETYSKGKQNIYQRPVTLSAGVVLEAFHTDILDGNQVKDGVVLKLLNNNLIVGKYNDEGGLATLLGHTIEDLDIQIDTVSYNSSAEKITVKVKLGNQNYWLGNGGTFEITVTKTKIVAEYGQLGKTSASVTMYAVNESGNRTAPTYVASGVTYLIYVKDENDGNKGYAYYKNETPIRNVTMTKSSTTGVYVATYDALPAGSYVMFAIAEGYTIIE